MAIISAVGKCLITPKLVAPPITGKWYPGHYWKLEQWQVENQSTGLLNTSMLNTIFAEIAASPGCRGIKWTTNWGKVENGNWTAINELCKRLYALRTGPSPKYARLMLAIDFKADGVGPGDINQCIPDDLIVEGGFTPNKGGYTAYTKAFPWAKPSGAVGGYYPKLWDTTIQSRLNSFMQTLANYVPPSCDGLSLDSGDILAMVSSLESAPGPIYDTYQGGSQTQFENGLWSFVQNMKLAFTKTPVTMSLNYSQSFVQDIIPQLHAKKIGINTPNSNFAKGLIRVAAPQGILKYFEDPAIYNSLIMNSEIQGDDFKSDHGIDARDDKLDVLDENPHINGYNFPAYATLLDWCINRLHNHYTVWQRTLPFWDGGSFSENLQANDPSYNGGVGTTPYVWPGTRPSFINFFQTNPIINNVSDPAGGNNSVKPTNWL